MVIVNAKVGDVKFTNIQLKNVSESAVLQYLEKEEENFEREILTELQEIVNSKLEGTGIAVDVTDWRNLEVLEIIVE